MFRKDDCPVIKNGVPVSDTQVFNTEELVSAVCFDDNWNSEQYLVELATRCAFFRWSTNYKKRTIPFRKHAGCLPGSTHKACRHLP